MQNLVLLCCLLGALLVVAIIYCVYLENGWNKSNKEWYNMCKKNLNSDHEQYLSMTEMYEEHIKRLNENYDTLDTVATLINKRNKQLIEENAELKAEVDNLKKIKVIINV